MMKNDRQRRANSIARAAGYGSATGVIDGVTDRVMSHTRRGYRKRSTGEYVSLAYLVRFGRENTYYQHAETMVELKSV